MRPLIFTIALLAVSLVFAFSEQPAGFTLRDSCPPSFELTDAEVCELRNPYQFYSSTQNQGVGGTHTGLPPDYRDGFSPREIDLGRWVCRARK